MIQGTPKPRKLVPTRRSQKHPAPPRPVEMGSGNNSDPFGISIEALSTEADQEPSNAAEVPRGLHFLMQCFRAYVDANPDRFTLRVRNVGGKRIHFVTLTKGEPN